LQSVEVRFNRKTNIIRTIAGSNKSIAAQTNNPRETDPLKLNLPKISSMDYHDRRLLVPTDIDPNSGDLIVIRKLGQRE
jgi:hypothetical protein